MNIQELEVITRFSHETVFIVCRDDNGEKRLYYFNKAAAGAT